jgi:signal-transduction protein with cAMP-binding, CBS, and nucleotidyltransferase domain
MEPCNETNTIGADADGFSAMQLMGKGHAERLIVTDGNVILGVVSLKDLLRFVSMHLELSPDSEETEKPLSFARRPLPRLRTTSTLRG